MLTKLLGALAFLAGIGAVVWSLTARMTTGEQAATLAVAAFTFAGAVGIWNISDSLEEYVKGK